MLISQNFVPLTGSPVWKTEPNNVELGACSELGAQQGECALSIGASPGHLM